MNALGLVLDRRMLTLPVEPLGGRGKDDMPPYCRKRLRVSASASQKPPTA